MPELAPALLAAYVGLGLVVGFVARLLRARGGRSAPLSPRS